MKWIIRVNSREYYLDPIVEVRTVPFYAVQGRAKKGGRSKY